MKYELIPAILSKNAKDAKKKFDQCRGLASWVQIDVMDGTFVKQKSWHRVPDIRAWDVALSLELHLMVNDPFAVMRQWRPVPQCKRVLWHVEAPCDHAKLLNWCAKNNIEGGLALSPDTPVDALTPYLYHKAFSRALILGVHPGKSGQKTLPSTYKKIRALRGLLPKFPIAFDGGVKKSNIPLLARHGVTGFCVASAIFSAAEPREKIQELKTLIRSLA